MSEGTLYIIGLGPGDPSLLPPLAVAALEKCSVLAGYSPYLELLEARHLQGRHIIKSGMMGEVARCNAAINAALGIEPGAALGTALGAGTGTPAAKGTGAGRNVALVCSGDSGIYALAGLVFELMEKRGLGLTDLAVEVIPGIPALCGAAALLGAPLMHDFAVISLSDLLTPWELIEKRALAALEADFTLAIYNPRSKKRDWQLGKVLEHARRIRGGHTPAGVVRNAYRAEQDVRVMPLAQLDAASVDMLSIVLLGNSQTRILPAPGPNPHNWAAGARMITPRGYAEKYKL